MELEFSKTSFPYLNCIYQDTLYHEETGEIIVPNSDSDIEMILSSYANVVLRGKDCSDGAVTIAGGIKGYILYTPEDHSGVKELKIYLPFSIRVENPLLTQNSAVIASLRTASVDGIMLNSRKARLRVNISCALSCYEYAEETLFELKNQPDELQTKEQTYSLIVPAESSEKSFMISENLNLTPNMPPIERICRDDCRIELSEIKLIANKVVFKGYIHMKLLYTAGENGIYTYEQEIPFSQYCEFGQDYDDQHVDVIPVITGYDIDLQETQENSVITVNILMQGIVYKTTSVSLLEDAYCTISAFEPQWKEYRLNTQLDETRDRRHIRCQVRGEIAQILDVFVFAGHPSYDRTEDSFKIKTPLSIQLLVLNNSGELSSISSKTEDNQVFSLAAGAKCMSYADVVSTASFSIFSGGVEVFFDLQTENRFSASQTFQTLSAGTITPKEKGGNREPALIIKRVDDVSDLWSIAKQYHAKVDHIRAANQLQESSSDITPLLLIPLG